MLDADRQPDIAGRHAARELIGGTELRVCGAGRMDGERACIADVGHMIEELECIDETGTSLMALLQFKADQSSQPVEIRLGAAPQSASSCKPG